jgi:hypothetical protein
MDDLLLVGFVVLGVVGVIGLWAAARAGRSRNLPAGPAQQTSTPPPVIAPPPDQRSEDRAALPSNTPAAVTSNIPATATDNPTDATERLKNWSPAIVQASQTGTRFEGEVRAADCSEPGGDCGFAIVGESNYQPMLRRVAKQGRTFRALLIPEPNNPYDPNAIAVWAEGGGPIGYLSRENAFEYREVFAFLTEQQHVGVCRAKLIGGTPGKRTYGVLIDLRETESLLTDLRDSLAPGTPVSDRVQPF